MEQNNKIWRNWVIADDFERIKLVKDLMITKNFAELYYPKLSKEMALDTVATLLNSYFEDLYYTAIMILDEQNNNGDEI